MATGFSYFIHGDTMLTIREFCAFAKISITHFYTLKAQGLGPNLVRIGRSVRISQEGTQAWITKYTERAD